MPKFKPGDEITAVYRNNANRHVLLLKATKVGRKYIHGITLSLDPDGQLREGHTIKVNIEESTIYPGLRHELRKAEFNYRDEYRRWQHQRQEKKTEINWELRNLVVSLLDEWEQENPMPKPPELPAPARALEVFEGSRQPLNEAEPFSDTCN